MKVILENHRIQRFYHFTSIDNLPVIAECGGIWSKQKLEQAGLLDRVITGGNDLSLSLDRSLGNWNKVSLHFCPRTPMLYRTQENFSNRDPQSAHVCYLIIDPTVALWAGVTFTDTNATRTTDGQQRKQGLEGLKLIDFDTIKAHLNRRWVETKEKWHRNVQAECLVLDGIPLECVKAISFISEASLKEGERLWGSADHPPFDTDEKLFHRGFPLVEKFLLTSKEVTKNNVWTLSSPDEKNFSLSADTRITLVVYLQAITGIHAKVIWLDSLSRVIREDNEEFKEANRYAHYPRFEIIDLQEGDYSVEYYLRDIRWFKARFKVER